MCNPSNVLPSYLLKPSNVSGFLLKIFSFQLTFLFSGALTCHLSHDPPSQCRPSLEGRRRCQHQRPHHLENQFLLSFRDLQKSRRWKIMKNGKFPEREICDDSVLLSCKKIDWLMQKVFHEKSALIGNRFLIGLHVNDHSMCRKKYFPIFNLIFIPAEGWHKKHSGWKKRNWILLMSHFGDDELPKKAFFPDFHMFACTHDSWEIKKAAASVKREIN